MIIYQLTLGSHLQAESFEAFARQRYLPSLSRAATRVGQLQDATLLRRSREHEGDPLDLDRQFLLLVGWSGVPLERLPVVDDPVVQRLFDVFAPQVVRLGGYQPVEVEIGP